MKLGEEKIIPEKISKVSCDLAPDIFMARVYLFQFCY